MILQVVVILIGNCTSGNGGFAASTYVYFSALNSWSVEVAEEDQVAHAEDKT